MLTESKRTPKSVRIAPQRDILMKPVFVGGVVPPYLGKENPLEAERMTHIFLGVSSLSGKIYERR